MGGLLAGVAAWASASPVIVAVTCIAELPENTVSSPSSITAHYCGTVGLHSRSTPNNLQLPVTAPLPRPSLLPLISKRDGQHDGDVPDGYPRVAASAAAATAATLHYDGNCSQPVGSDGTNCGLCRNRRF